jgi:hypothetical protein
LEKPLLQNLIQDGEHRVVFAQWLNRLSWAAEGGQREVEQTRFQGFYQAIVSNLNEAERNEEFRKYFWHIVEEGCRSCGDRIALSVIDMGISRRGFELSGKGVQASWAYLKQRLALGVLQKCAAEKIPTMHFFDEIEVYLAFVLRGWERLKLPLLDVTEMLFASGVTNADIDQAAEKVRHAWIDLEGVSNYLLEQSEWMSALGVSYPKEMQKVKEAKDRLQKIQAEVSLKMQDLSEEELERDSLYREYEELEKYIQRDYKELTDKALAEIDGSFK